MAEMIIGAITENILNIIIAIISIVVSYYIIPCIKDDLVPWLKSKRIYNMVKTFVQAAEKLAESGVIEKTDKKQGVIKLLKEQGIEITDSVDAFIESAVKELDLVTSIVKEEILKEENDKMSK